MQSSKLHKWFFFKDSIAPLVVFRIFYGLLMSGAALRFLLKGWVYEQYVKPNFHFSYYGFEWVSVLPEWAMYASFISMVILGLFIALGFLYRVSMVLYFLIFTYVELIDVTYYLNHYYFMSLLAFLMIFIPANRALSLDNFVFKRPNQTEVSVFYKRCIQIILSLVYVFAGIAKLNPDWLLEAMPLKVWLPSQSHWPIIGPLFNWVEVAFFFSWAGAIYDLTIPYFLSLKKTRLIAYLSVVFFHGITAFLFQIGMFPWIMMVATTIFFSSSFHQTIYDFLAHKFKANLHPSKSVITPSKYLISFLSILLVWQVIWPFRYVTYPGKLFWTEQGYRFSWRVMLMEKMGNINYLVVDERTGNSIEVDPQDFLEPVQYKMLATQPDLILQFAHFLGEWAKGKSIDSPQVFARSFVSLQGKSIRPFIDPEVDLLKEKDTFAAKSWILPYEE